MERTYHELTDSVVVSFSKKSMTVLSKKYVGFIMREEVVGSGGRVVEWRTVNRGHGATVTMVQSHLSPF